MPYYKHDHFLHRSDETLFDQVHDPGVAAPCSGIYRCETCGFEAVSSDRNPLPAAQDCQQHDSRWHCQPGIVRWRLVSAVIHVT